MINLLFGFLFVISTIVFVHEMGHYIAARICGVKIETFSLGFGPSIYNVKDKYETIWKICIIPVGGYVKMFGDDDISSSSLVDAKLSEEEKKRSFIFQPPLKRIFIAIAGPLANYILAFVIFFGIYMFLGKVIATNEIGGVIEDSPAFREGIKVGDIITSIDGRKISRFEDIQSYLILRPKQLIKFEINRKGQLINISLVSGSRDLKDERDKLIAQIGFIGISPNAEYVNSLGLIGSSAESLRELHNLTMVNIDSLTQIITGKRSLKELRGTITIAKDSGRLIEKSYISFLVYIAIVSVSIGFANLLPIPILDGGHIALCCYEIIAGKALTGIAHKAIIYIGLALVIFMFIISTSNDINSLL
ncbi:MAG: M50 family metallopeptidase [Rickettsiaceae bacterium]|nr:M50 family metallopeptidase [Rickettsiaceae bacterium]